MSILTLYHGSSKIISSPQLERSDPCNDFGPGFYCTDSESDAGKWACRRGSGGFINRYRIDTEGMDILDLSSEDYGLMFWLSVVCTNRSFRITSPNAARFIDHMKTYFRVIPDNYDIIIGNRCDESYFTFVRSFLKGEISYRQLKSLIGPGKAGQQIVLRSEYALSSLRFDTCMRADAESNYPKRKIRDYNIRTVWKAQLEIGDEDGLFMNDLLREGVRPGDARIQ